MKVATNTARVLFENSKIRVMEGQFKKGQRFEMHSHPANLIYAVTDVKFKQTHPEGRTEVVELRKGDSMFNEALNHAVEFQTSGVYLQVELK